MNSFQKMIYEEMNDEPISNNKLYQQGRAEGIDEFRKFSYCKVCEEKGWDIYCDYCRVCQAQEYIAEQLKEHK